jgi:hypothetical protein
MRTNKLYPHLIFISFLLMWSISCYSQMEFKVGERFVVKEKLQNLFEDYVDQVCKPNTYNTEPNTVFEVRYVKSTSIVVLIIKAYWPEDKEYDQNQVKLNAVYCVKTSDIEDKVERARKDLLGNFKKSSGEK